MSGGPTSGSRFPRRIATKFFSTPPYSSALLRQVLDEERPGESNMWPDMDLYHEALGRIFRMCGVR
jgi:hypothetical protein